VGSISLIAIFYREGMNDLQFKKEWGKESVLLVFLSKKYGGGGDE